MTEFIGQGRRTLSQSQVLTGLVAISITSLWINQRGANSIMCGASCDAVFNVSNIERRYKHTYQHDVTTLPTVVSCNETMMSIINQQIPNKNVLSQSTACPETVWVDAFFGNTSDIGSNQFVGISVGCNKGNDAIRTARMGMSLSDFNETGWNKAIIAANGGKEMRFACSQDGKRVEFEVNFSGREGEMHCIEPMPSNFALLMNATQSLGLDKKNFVVTNAAVASANGAVLFPAAGSGTESMGIHDCSNGNGCETVPLYTLDSYVEKFVHSRGPVNVLQIDTEGWDFNVLFGGTLYLIGDLGLLILVVEVAS
jgi:FkbM family methyltransferase